MPSHEVRRPSRVRALLESTGIPFAVADYRPQALIFRQGDPSDSVMYIEKGRVRLTVSTPDGKEAIYGLLDAGAFLGEEALTGRPVRRETAIAMAAATGVIAIAKAQMIHLLRTRHAITDRFIAYMLAREIQLESDLTDQLLKSAEQRLARTLVVLAGCCERGARRCALPAVSQGVIAEMVGTTRSRVNVFMGKFKRLGHIEEVRGVLHVKPSLLRVVDGGIDVSRTAQAQSQSGANV